MRYHTGDSTLRRSRASTASLLALRAALTLFITLAGLAMATVFHTEPNASAMPAPTGVASASARIAPAVSRMASEGNRSAQVAPRQAPEITPTALTTPEQQTFDLINQRRVAMGLQAFRLDWNLTAAARRHSNDIGPAGLCQHNGTDGSSPWDRIAQSGYTGFGNGEVVGCGYNSAQGVVDAWWNSPGHYAILTNADANDIGCGWWLDPDGYGWQTCDTGISAQSTATATPVPPTVTRTPVRTSTPTRTATARSTNTPTNTPVRTATPNPARYLVGHVIWQGRPAQPGNLQQIPVTLTLSLNGVNTSFTQTTDASGFFTVSVTSLANNTYAWRAKGSQYLSNAGSVTLAGLQTTRVDMELMRVGDANNDNAVNVMDYNIMNATMGRSLGDPNYDSRADFNGDNVVNSTDFTLIRANMGASGA